MDRLYQHVEVELQEDWCKSKPPYFEIAEAMHRKQRYKLEELMAKGVETGGSPRKRRSTCRVTPFLARMVS